MDDDLRPRKLALHTPLWIKVLPLVFVALVAYGVLTGAHKERETPRGDVTSQVRPH